MKAGVLQFPGEMLYCKEHGAHWYQYTMAKPSRKPFRKPLEGLWRTLIRCPTCHGDMQAMPWGTILIWDERPV